MINDFIETVIKELQNIYKGDKYSIYDEGHIAFLIRNDIWNKYKHNDKENYCIFNEFPIKLRYPRFITSNVYKKIIIQNFFKPPVAGYAELNENVSDENRNKLVEYFENEEPTNTDVGIINVDFTIINEKNYLNSEAEDKCISNHECVLQLKFERGKENRTFSESNKNTKYYIRKDINKKNSTNDIRSILRDIKNMCSLVEDNKSMFGYFMFICEGNKSISKYFRACEGNEITDRYYNRDERNNIKLLFNAKESGKFKEYCNNGFIYIYEKVKDGCKAWTVPLRPQH